MRLNHGWIGAFMGTACLSLALLVPSSALATGSHHLTMYKVEKHVTLDGDFDAIPLSCYANDFALDGMWRIDHVDQDSDYPGNVLTAVSVYDSYGDSGNAGLWHFTFANEGSGDVQLKVWLTCLGQKTAPNTHQHAWTISDQMSAGNIGPVTSGTPGTPAYTTIATSQANSSTPNTCATYNSKSLLVAPGFHVNSGADPLRLVGNYPIGAVGNLQQTWSWRFEARGSGSKVDVLWRCLETRSSTVGTHSHRIYYKLKYGANLPLPSDSQKEHVVSCGDQYKGMVAGFWLSGTSAEKWVWYLGMDPRIKARAFQFLNTDPVNNYQVDTSLLCFQDRTN